MEWKHKQSPCKKKFKTQPSAGKLLLTVFWDSQGPVQEHYQERGTTINSAWYSEMLTDRLKPANRSKLRLLLSKRVVLHDNARPHTAAHSAETLRKLKIEVMAHPPYNRDPAPSNYHLFGPFKEVFRGRRFTSDQEVKEAVLSRKPPFRRASGRLCHDGPSALKSKGTVLKNDLNISFLFVCLTLPKVVFYLKCFAQELWL